MALQMQLTTEQGFVAPNAYLRVEKVLASKSSATATVCAYKDSNTDNVVEIWSKSYQLGVDLDGDNFIAQAYLYLKTLPEFSGAIDV